MYRRDEGDHIGNIAVGSAKENSIMTATKPAERPNTDPVSNAEKDPDNWTTGDERMTGAQGSYLKTLCEEAGCRDRYNPELTKADASKMIDELQAETGRGQ